MYYSGGAGARAVSSRDLPRTCRAADSVEEARRPARYRQTPGHADDPCTDHLRQHRVLARAAGTPPTRRFRPRSRVPGPESTRSVDAARTRPPRVAPALGPLGFRPGRRVPHDPGHASRGSRHETPAPLRSRSRSRPATARACRPSRNLEGVWTRAMARLPGLRRVGICCVGRTPPTDGTRAMRAEMRPTARLPRDSACFCVGSDVDYCVGWCAANW